MRRIAVVSLVVTCLFFVEYLPPFKRVHFAYDIQGFHYPLLNYAFQALREGRFPEWDPTLYCGLSFIGNPQAAVFYPPNWLLFAANLGRERLSFLSLEILVIAHFWLAFLLCHAWLRGKRLAPMACALASAVFAYSGYMVSQVQHVGVVTGYAWFPLGLWGIDEAAGTGDWRRLWKVLVASALCFLAGYPPTWFVFAVCMIVYAAARGVVWQTGVVLAASLLTVAVQLLPALEAAGMKVRELKYGGGLYGGKFYLSYFIPNYFNVGRKSIGDTDPTREYFYLGVPAFFALACLVWRRGLRGQLPALAIGGVCLLAFANPFGVVGAVVNRIPALSEICRDWNFLAGITLAAALLTGLALDDFLQGSSTLPRWLMPVSMVVNMVLLVFGRGALEPLTTLAAFSLGIWVWRSEKGLRRTILGATLLLSVGVDYKVLGTGKIFNADTGDVDKYYADPGFPFLDQAVYQAMHSKPEFRVGLQPTGPLPTDLRLFGLHTPQGFDPMLTAQYKQAIETFTPFRTDRLFDIDPGNEAMLRLLAVRYFLTNESGPLYPALSRSSKFRQIPPAQSFFRVFEYLDAVPAYRWEGYGGPIECRIWKPERREFVVHATTGGRFVLIEQYFPGWLATVDGHARPIERWHGAFQAIRVEPGDHRIAFEFRSTGLRVGAVLTLLSIGSGICLMRQRGEK